MAKDFLDGFKEIDFLEGFKIQPKDLEIRQRKDTSCPPPPATTKVSAEGRSNAQTLAANAANGYGMTGLMAMNTWDTNCYGEVRPGYVFLFPGTYENNPPIYQGSISLNCKKRSALTSQNGALHGQMCQILGRPTEDFIGFAFKFPFTAPNNMGYHSWTCNPYWFNGSNEIPSNCGGTDWQAIIYDTLITWLSR